MILGGAHAADRNGFADQALLLARRAPLVFGKKGVDLVPHRCVDDARRYAVDVYAVLDEGEAGRLGYVDDGRFRRAIDGDERLAAAAGLRCHVDDLAAPLACDHLASDRL